MTNLTSYPTNLIPLAELRVSPHNVRKYDAKDVADLADSIAAIGLIQPPVVRKSTDPTFDGYDVFAGGRRYNAIRKNAGDGAADIIVPCTTLPDDMSDADAIAISLEENTNRKAMDPIDEYKAIVDMMKSGSDENHIAKTLRLDAITVRRRLALGKLTPAVHKLYRDGQIDDTELAALTLATQTVQRKFVAAVADGTAPDGHRLKAWIQGSNAEITTAVALFDVTAYTGPLRQDLFGAADTSLFLDVEDFWKHQNAAIAARKDAYEGKGWKTLLIPPGTQYRHWEYTNVSKTRGGEIHIVVEQSGRVQFFEGRGSHAQARNAEAAALAVSQGDSIVSAPAEDDSAKRPELTVPLANYVDCTRLAIVRSELAKKPKVALRVLAALLLAGDSQNLRTHAEPYQKLNADTVIAVDKLPASVAFAERQAAARELVHKKPKAKAADPHLVGSISSADTAFAKLFAQLEERSDQEIMTLLTIMTAEVLGLGTTLIDQIGAALQIDTAKHWKADESILRLMTSRDISIAALEEVGGKEAVAENITASGKHMRDLVLIAVEDGTAWCPPWLRFPAEQYDSGRAARAHDPRAA